MEQRKQLGQDSEQLARRFLERQGYSVVQSNFSCRWGEIDIICTQGELLVFAEVRSRTGQQYGLPSETVNWKKQQKVRKAAACYLHQHPQWAQCYCRFDVLSVLWQQGTAQIEWIADAFQ